MRKGHRKAGIKIIISLVFLCAFASILFLGKRIEFLFLTHFWFKPEQIVYEMDTTGWFGDGDKMMILQGTNENKEIAKCKWNKLPVGDLLRPYVYGSDQIQSYFRYPAENRLFFPEITEGAYIFVDRRHLKSEDQFNYNDAAYNVTLIMFDYSDNKIYYYELDM